METIKVGGANMPSVGLGLRAGASLHGLRAGA